MKFILAFTICSAITGYCNNTMTLPTKFDSWSECVGAGGKLIQSFSVDMKDTIEERKLYMNYFCNENHTNKTPT
jgi:hypothetical protein